MQISFSLFLLFSIRVIRVIRGDLSWRLGGLSLSVVFPEPDGLQFRLREGVGPSAEPVPTIRCGKAWRLAHGPGGTVRVSGMQTPTEHPRRMAPSADALQTLRHDRAS